MLEAIRICRRSGMVRQRPQRVAGDKGYSHRRIRQWRRKRGIQAVIPERKDQRAHRRGRPPKFER
ncbi:transposase [Paludibacterium paludis]|uniref:transposase n=1 Tax=Paludibacterium paludis TaxID=1225769 RepID=UPI0016744FDF